MTDSDDLRSLKTSRLYCLLVQVRDNTPDDIQRNVEQVIPIYAKHSGVIIDMIASIQLVLFGLFAATLQNMSDDSRETAEELLNLTEDQVRIVAFNGNISYGNIGTNNSMNYTACLPKFDRLLAALLGTEYGCITELGTLP
jgi:hypothetical protein